jgi:hypothetical protein
VVTSGLTNGAPLVASLPPIDELDRAYAGTPFDAVRAFRAVDDYAKPVMRHVLCTVNRYDAEQMQLVRLYSSHPQTYPPGGRKDKRGTFWGQKVLLDRQVYVGEGTRAISEAFDDHAVIAQLGLQSIVNVPVVFGERCLGTLNLLMPAPTVGIAQVDFARLLGMLLLPAFLGDQMRWNADVDNGPLSSNTTVSRTKTL